MLLGQEGRQSEDLDLQLEDVYEVFDGCFEHHRLLLAENVEQELQSVSFFSLFAEHKHQVCDESECEALHLGNALHQVLLQFAVLDILEHLVEDFENETRWFILNLCVEELFDVVDFC